LTILDLPVWQLILIASAALGTQLVSGLAGSGNGLLMSLILVPILGPAAVVPVIGVSGIMSNLTRAVVFRSSIDWARGLIVGMCAVPAAILGAWSYTLLSGRGASIVIGGVMLALVPLRRYLAGARMTLGVKGGVFAAMGYGFVSGGANGVGVILLAIFMAMGLSGMAVIATDSVATIIIGIAKAGVFTAAGALPPKHWLIAFSIGIMAVPGTYLARWLAERFAAHVHDMLIESVIVLGAVLLIWRALAA
jgi:uncharacterized membrane protein YfcA